MRTPAKNTTKQTIRREKQTVQEPLQKSAQKMTSFLVLSCWD